MIYTRGILQLHILSDSRNRRLDGIMYETSIVF